MSQSSHPCNLAKKIQRAAQAIADADAVLICAGAGMGVDSGLPDFRGAQGFWRAYPLMGKLGLSFEEMANPRWFETDPHLAWAFYGHRLNLYRRALPHEGFARLLEIGSSKPGSYFVFTSNVDGHFQKAGFEDDRVVECHGSIHHLQCIRLCSENIWEAEPGPIQIDEAQFRAFDPLPKCRNCSALARPNVLMFGDGSWLDHRTQAQELRLEAWFEDVSAARLAIIELGAGSGIPTVRHFAELAAAKTCGTLIRINPMEYSVPEGGIGLPMGAAEAMAQLAQNLLS
jgi:NAD-dependent SIR2 family protein deacetylase